MSASSTHVTQSTPGAAFGLIAQYARRSRDGVTWCSSAVNRASLSRRATSRTRPSALDASVPALGPGCVLLTVFPLARSLSSPTSAAVALFGGFAGTTKRSDFPRSCISGVPPRCSLSGPPSDQLDGRGWDLPVLAPGGSVHAMVLRPRGVHQRLAIAPPAVLPSAVSTTWAPRCSHFAAQ